MIHPTDREPFATAITRLFAIYGDEVTKNLLDAWWGVLSGYDLREVRWAMNAHATDPEKGRFRPLPADIIRHITETMPAERARRRRERVLAARAAIAPLENELYRLQTDLNLSLIPESDVASVRARINGLSMQIGAMTREAGIDDRPRMSGPSSAPQALGKLVKALAG